MNPNRYVPGQTSALRKSRLEGKVSMLPKPLRPGSTDRLSTEARRPSTTGHRSISAEPARGTFGGGRLSREASATKIPLHGRSRSQQGDRYGQSSMTPLRSSQYSGRPTTTPTRTPTDDRSNRSWQTSLDRALAFVTVKDQRPISSVAWQRSECVRVGEALSCRSEGQVGGGGGMALMRPLTIARFVDITQALLKHITRDAKLNTDNYVTKLPHLSKRLLYPGTVSKSWLKTVNTLHAFPHALALIAYLLDLVNHIEMPVSDEWLYIDQNEAACLRREYLYRCWVRFQEPDHQFEELNEEYLRNLKVLLGNDEERIVQLTQEIEQVEARLEDQVAGVSDERRRIDRRDHLLASLRAARAHRRDDRATTEREHARSTDLHDTLKQLDIDIERATAESHQLKQELETQPLSVEQRTKLLDEVDYANRVMDSKRALAEQIGKMLQSKETELALWQKKTLDSCVEYKQGLIHLSAQFPDLHALAIEEKELMSAECSALVSRGVEALRARAGTLALKRAEHARERTALARKRAALLEETRSKIVELKSSVNREQESLEAESSKEAQECMSAAAELREVCDRIHELKVQQDHYARVDAELTFWEQQEQAWRTKLSALQEYIASQEAEARRLIANAREKRVKLIMNHIALWNEKLA